MKYIAIMLSVLLISGLFINSGYGQSQIPDPPKNGMIPMSGTMYYREVTSLFEFESTPEDVLQSTLPVTRISGPQEIFECSTVSEYNVMQTRMERFRIDLYATVEKFSTWDWIGVVLIGVAIVVATIATAGAAAAVTAITITGGAAASMGLVATGIAAGGTIMIVENTDYEKTNNLVSSSFMDIPIELPRVIDTKTKQTPWIPCGATIVRSP